MRQLTFFFLGIVLLTGCRSDPPAEPSKAVLIEPARNEECTPVVDSNDDSNVVRFAWQAADNAESYELKVIDLISGEPETIPTTQTTVTLSLQKGNPFSWTVISKNSQTTVDVSSDTWFFYNPGAQTDHVPFPAEIIAPRPGAGAFKNADNEVELQWSGSDVDNDIESYDIFFSTENPPDILIANTEANETTLEVSVIPSTVYYWKVITKDAEGNLSDTGVLDFKVF
ncbi:MAG: hypothetical protein WA913_04180 [Pricia sp.]